MLNTGSALAQSPGAFKHGRWDNYWLILLTEYKSVPGKYFSPCNSVHSPFPNFPSSSQVYRSKRQGVSQKLCSQTCKESSRDLVELIHGSHFHLRYEMYQTSAQTHLLAACVYSLCFPPVFMIQVDLQRSSCNALASQGCYQTWEFKASLPRKQSLKYFLCISYLRKVWVMATVQGAANNWLILLFEDNIQNLK